VLHGLLGPRLGQEKLAFEKSMDFLMRHLDSHPDLHVYHYANYEERAVKDRSSWGRHGTRETEVDGSSEPASSSTCTGRCGRRQTSQESYSFKKLEPLYRVEVRHSEIQDVGSSIVALRALAGGAATRDPRRDRGLQPGRLRHLDRPSRVAGGKAE
jgi:hypothetical protein